MTVDLLQKDSVSEGGPDHREPVRFRILISLCGMLAGVIGIVALLGWVLDIPFLTSLGPGNIPMAPSTAVLFTLHGVTVYLRSRVPRPGVYWTGLAVHAVGALIALALAVLSYQGIHPEIEHLGISIVHTPGVTPLGHMSPITAICFLLASLSFIASLLSSPSRPWRADVSWLLACLLLAIIYLFVLAYLFGTPLLYGSSFIPPALPTSLAVAALGIALFALAWPHAWLSLRKTEGTERAPYGLIVTYVILAAGILALGYLFYRGYEKSYRIEVERQLSSIAELKVNELIKWRNERLDDGAVIYHNSLFSRLARRYFRNPRDKDAENRLREWMGLYPTQYEYTQVRLLDVKGSTLMSVPAERSPVSTAVLKGMTGLLQSRRIELTDFYWQNYDRHIFLSVLIPISDAARGNRIIGVVSLRIDPDKYLYSNILRHPSFSKTAETLIVRREGDSVLYLNEIKAKKDMALKFRIALGNMDAPSVMAVLGRTGIVEGVDYKGGPVIADIRSVPDSPWFLVTQMSTSEVYASVRENLWLISGLVIALLFGSGAALAFVWRHQSMGFYQEQYAAAEKLLREKAFSDKLLNAQQDTVFLFDPATGTPLKWNKTFAEVSGYSDEEIANMKTPEDFYGEGDIIKAREAMKNMQQEGTGTVELALVTKQGAHIPFEYSVVAVEDTERRKLYFSIGRDITERRKSQEALKLNEDRLETLLKLTAMKAGSENEVTAFALEEAVRLTSSKGGYLHFFNEDEKTIQLYAWSKEVLKYCTAAKDDHYPLDRAGVWADSVRLKRPVIHNDYQNLPDKKGYPAGHFRLIRHLGVPVFDKERIVGAMGVGNKEEPYSEIDAVQVSLFMNSMWTILKQKRTEDEREKMILELREALANVKTLSGMLPICASCKKIRDDKGYWNRIESYISRHTEVLFSHGLCPDCEKKAYEEFEKLKNNKTGRK